MSYSQRKNVMTKQDKAALSKWALQHPTAEQEAKRISEQRRKLWDALNSYCMERAGFITSKPYASPVRLEVPPESQLPDRLAKAGYPISFLCRESKVGGDKCFTTCDVYHIPLPK